MTFQEAEKIKLFSLIEIYWIDSLIINDFAWNWLPDIKWEKKKLELFHNTTGYVVKIDESFIAVAMSKRTIDENVGGIWVIPLVQITRVEVIKNGRQKNTTKL